ncbi:hypothetical protein KUCAC02_026064, partial [Chaenocephalus aceratus]
PPAEPQNAHTPPHVCTFTRTYTHRLQRQPPMSHEGTDLGIFQTTVVQSYAMQLYVLPDGQVVKSQRRPEGR